jgi:O-antigen/teichoic acid export membrane protein/protein-L-isoaspartate O-methyltransferase
MNVQARPLLRVGKNALARFSAQAWGKLFSLAVAALIGRYEDAAGLGRYVLVLSVVGIVGALSDLGLNTFLTREAAQDGDRAGQREMLGLVLPLKVGLSLVGYGGLVLIAVLAPFPPATRRLLPLGGLALLPDATMGAMGAVINGRRRMEVTGLLSMIVRLVALAGALWALATGGGVAGVLGWSVAAALLGALLHGAVLWRWRLTPRLRWDPAAWGGCLAEAYPFAMTSFIAVAYTRFDLVLLSLWQGEAVAGWYGAAYRLWQAVGLLPASLLDALFPELSRLAQRREGRQRLRSLFRTGLGAMLAVGIALTVGGTLGAQALISLIYGPGESYTPTVVVFRLLVWAIPAMFLYLLSGHTLYALGEQRRVTLAMAVAGLVNVTLNVAVIPRWGGRGAGAVALLSEWLLLVLLYPQARRALEGKKMKPDRRTTSQAFDAVASEYDAIYGAEGNAVMTWMRRESLALLKEVFPPGSRLLEIGCGTGDEALHLARRGHTVLATDISPAMAAQTRAKARAAGLDDRIAALALPAGNLAALRLPRPFDGAYASFGALNCEPDLDAVSAALARILQPGGRFVCSVMARWCPFETTWFLLHARPRAAVRRLRRGWQSMPVAGEAGREVRVAARYLSARDVARAFEPAFTLERTMSLPLLLPPPYLDPVFRRRRSLFTRLEGWERRLRERWPWRTMGDHVALVLRRIPLREERNG